ncbi:hypothetical protein [Reinekea sp.]|uniref:hypothetical protein n=1 Tax=Reinekea sp. TaxID=1970455 RepID=UPI00398A4575
MTCDFNQGGLSSVALYGGYGPQSRRQPVERSLFAHPAPLSFGIHASDIRSTGRRQLCLF